MDRLDDGIRSTHRFILGERAQTTLHGGLEDRRKHAGAAENDFLQTARMSESKYTTNAMWDGPGAASLRYPLAVDVKREQKQKTKIRQYTLRMRESCIPHVLAVRTCFSNDICILCGMKNILVWIYTTPCTNNTISVDVHKIPELRSPRIRISNARN